MIFRPMTRKDVSRIAALERICFAMPWSVGSLNGELKNPAAHYMVIEREGQVIAYAGMWIIFEEAHITNVAVDPEVRRQGLGRLIMLGMMAEAMKLGASRMTLEVRETNIAAQHLYDGCDFYKAGVRRGYYSNTGEDAWIMWNDDIAATVKKLREVIVNNPADAGLEDDNVLS